MYKAGKILELITQNPHLTTKEVAKRTGSHTSYVQRIRNQMIHIGTGEPAEVAAPESAAVALVEERRSEHGVFIQTATTSQQLKDAIGDTLRKREKDLPPAQLEALAMICTKIARITNGDHLKVDHWADIAGYAQLVADGLQGKYR